MVEDTIFFSLYILSIIGIRAGLKATAAETSTTNQARKPLSFHSLCFFEAQNHPIIPSNLRCVVQENIEKMLT